MKKVAKNIKKICKLLLVLMITTSQLSFPLEVLADEIINQQSLTEESNYILKINGEKTLEYIVPSTNKIITIEQEYNGKYTDYVFDNLVNTIDFTNMLYGDYEYKYSVSNEEKGEIAKKIITIHYNGNNNEILSNYTSLKIIDNNIYINGNKDLLTIEDLLNEFDLTNLNDDYNSSIKIVDDLGVEKNLSDNLTNKDKLILTNSNVKEEYQIIINGDYNLDNIVDEEDAKALVDKILNKEENKLNNLPFNIIDATNSVFKTGVWDKETLAQDDLTNGLQSKNEVILGEELVVKYHINGFVNDVITGIQGKINYTESILKLKTIEVNEDYNLYGSNNDDLEFIYLLNNYNKSDTLLTLTFETISEGEAVISIDDIILSIDGSRANIDDDNISTSVNVLNFGIGGDVDTDDTDNETDKVVSVDNLKLPQVQVSNTNNNISVQKILLSTDNLIKNLTIKGYKINFDKNTYEYSINVKNTVKSLNLTIDLNSEAASYVISGNNDFKTGNNLVVITVTAEDGSTQDYKINVKKEEKEEEEDEEVEKTSSSKTVIIILIVLVIIGLIYVIFKDDEEENKGSK